MADVFISYASANASVPPRLSEVLVRAGYSVWWDAKLLSGQRYREALVDELSAASAVIVIWTSESVRSDWVYSEARRAADQEKLVQVRAGVGIGDLPAPFDAYHCPELSDEQAVLRAVANLVRRNSEERSNLPVSSESGADPALDDLPAEASHNLPPTLTQTVGRDGEIAELASYLLPTAGHHADRLVTLTGPGGSGKTRLSIEVARRVASGFPDGVVFTSLETVTDAGTAWVALGQQLDLSPEGQAREAVLDHLRFKRMLIVLDNVEQVAGADAMAHDLVLQAPSISLLVTSRRALKVIGEREHQVPSLIVPEVHAGTAAIAASGAVQLFVLHAARVKRGFTLTSENANHIAAICRALDGMPLAIELAAARAKLFSPAAILDRLDDALNLRAIETDRPSRQRTLRDTITWSYELLPRSHRQVLACLGVFAGDCDLPALEAVVTATAPTPIDVLSTVSDLVDESFVSVLEDHHRSPRVVPLRANDSTPKKPLELRFAHTPSSSSPEPLAGASGRSLARSPPAKWNRTWTIFGSPAAHSLCS